MGRPIGDVELVESEDAVRRPRRGAVEEVSGNSRVRVSDLDRLADSSEALAVERGRRTVDIGAGSIHRHIRDTRPTRGPSNNGRLERVPL